MDNQLDEFKVIKEMLESGAISKTEFDKLKADLLRKTMVDDGFAAQDSEESSRKWIWMLLILALIAGGLYWWWNSKKATDRSQAKEFAEQFCECEKLRNTAYISQLSDFVATLDDQKFKVLNELDLAIAKIMANYNENKFGIEISSCLNNIKAQRAKLESKYGSSESSVSQFWSECNVIIAGSVELTQQTQQIKALCEVIENKRGTFKYASAEDLQNRKSAVGVFLTEMYTQMPYDHFDSYVYFGYAVEKYFNLVNITPTDIKHRLMGETDHVSFNHKLIHETLELKGIDNEREEWLYCTEYYAWRPSMERHQIANVWYTIILNAENKIVSYTETIVENSKFYTQEEYNTLFGASETEIGL